jgi:hypothetical protein
MRRREKFVVLAVLLGVLMWVVQLVPLEWRHIVIAGFGVIAYFGSALVLREDLQPREWLTVLPVPAMYVVVVSQFYFLLPDNFWSRIFILGFFALGMYIILLAANIFSVAKGRTIALLNTAQSAMLFFSMLMVLLGVNTIWSFFQPFHINALMLAVVVWPLTISILWGVEVDKLSRELVALTTAVTFLMVSFGTILSFIPLEQWHAALLLMSFYYLVIGVVTMFLRDKLFHKVVGEYTLIAVFIGVMLLIFMPWK